MAITHVNSTSANSSVTEATKDFTLPSGGTTSDWIIAAMTINANTELITPPNANWNTLYSASANSALTVGIFWGWHENIGAGPFTFSAALGGAKVWAGGLTAYRGVDTTNPIHLSDSTIDATANGVVTAPTLSITEASVMLVCIFALTTATTAALPFSYSGALVERFAQQAAATTKRPIALADETTSTTPTGARTGTVTAGTGGDLGYAIALKVASGGGPPTYAEAGRAFSNLLSA